MAPAEWEGARQKHQLLTLVNGASPVLPFRLGGKALRLSHHTVSERRLAWLAPEGKEYSTDRPGTHRAYKK